ncbi:hypothetical protein O6H91_17G021100 [Diphasiastrum complanatum]|uniref:Uncharacterized protein n=2 Tax=Diphasiastrum complanatum TaxID=34168 RepID=A0ACC2B4S5_DIPCM|nr:hypothetical protein O6H91_17G021100 [Diphasiastrum complanatum]KAJ7524778.1 hypothetical protein O6H91_17G021100 [Diphasiastrum complanatum]
MRRVLFEGVGRQLRRLLNPCATSGLRSPILSTVSGTKYVHVQYLHAGKDGQDKRRGDPLRHKKISAQILDFISLAFQQGPYNSDLLLRCGLEINRVKMSSDLRVAYILWSSSPGMQRTIEKELKVHVARLRSMLFSELSMPFSPKIIFIEDKPNKHAQELEEALAALKESD